MNKQLWSNPVKFNQRQIKMKNKNRKKLEW